MVNRDESFCRVIEFVKEAMKMPRTGITVPTLVIAVASKGIGGTRAEATYWNVFNVEGKSSFRKAVWHLPYQEKIGKKVE